MCDLNASYATVVGPRGDLSRLAELWHEVPTVRRLGLPDPSLLSPDPDDGHFDEPTCPAVLLLRTRSGSASLVADRLQIDLLNGSGHLAGIRTVVEPGYSLYPASSVTGPPIVSFDPDLIAKTRDDFPPGPDASAEVVVLDSGDATASEMMDYTSGQPQIVPGSDATGHGTAVSGLIRKLRPSANVTAIRVLNDENRAESAYFFLALIYALWPTQAPLVNASLTTHREQGCASSLGKTIDFVVEECR
jgi:hypothetical protein